MSFSRHSTSIYHHPVNKPYPVISLNPNTKIDLYYAVEPIIHKHLTMNAALEYDIDLTEQKLYQDPMLINAMCSHSIQKDFSCTDLLQSSNIDMNNLYALVAKGNYNVLSDFLKSPPLDYLWNDKSSALVDMLLSNAYNMNLAKQHSELILNSISTILKDSSDNGTAHMNDIMNKLISNFNCNALNSKQIFHIILVQNSDEQTKLLLAKMIIQNIEQTIDWEPGRVMKFLYQSIVDYATRKCIINLNLEDAIIRIISSITQINQKSHIAIKLAIYVNKAIDLCKLPNKISCPLQKAIQSLYDTCTKLKTLSKFHYSFMHYSLKYCFITPKYAQLASFLIIPFVCLKQLLILNICLMADQSACVTSEQIDTIFQNEENSKLGYVLVDTLTIIQNQANASDIRKIALKYGDRWSDEHLRLLAANIS